MEAFAAANRLCGPIWLWLLCVAALLAALLPAGALAADSKGTACQSMIGRIVSVQGTVELRRAGQSAWTRLTRLDVPVCQGDWLRTAAKSRAALVVLPEKFVRIDQSSTLSVNISGDETIVEFLQSGDQSVQLDSASCGAGYFITRFPRNFKVRTNYLNAAVEGTEFLVGVACDATQVAVIEGKVSTQSPLSSNEHFLLTAGQTVSSGPQQTASVKLLVKPADAVQWALFYPPLTQADPQAIDRACLDPVGADRARCLLQRAEQRLRVGRADAANADIAKALSLRPDDADAHALLAIIAVVKNERAQALRLAERATQLDPRSLRAWIARSYAQQAIFQLDDALVSARHAVELDPRSTVAQARTAELLMSFGRIRDAAQVAQAAVAADANDSRAHTVLGFVHLAQVDITQARQDFLEAIERDPSDPLPRLGLGLAIIRQGNLVAGREQIEIAVLLDPTNALIRSYVGKAYYEEDSRERDRLAVTQFGLAQQLDPKDPTPWFYQAILELTQNRSVEALVDIERSIELNDDRAVYRSKLLLDEDLAARSASQARIYQDLGFDQLGALEAAKSLSYNFGDYSAHRFLSDIYAGQPRQDVGQASELLQSLLRQPINVDPVPALRPLETASLQLPKVGILKGFGSSQTTFNEFNPLFASNGLSLYLDGMGGSKDTWSNQEIVTGITDRTSFSLGYGHVQSDAFQTNNDFRMDAYDAFFQTMLSDRVNVQAEVNVAEFGGGDVISAFDPVNAGPLRIADKPSTFRLGSLIELSPGSNLVLSGIYQTRDVTFSTLDATSQQQARWEANTEEAQYLWQRDNLSLVTGAGHVEYSLKTTAVFLGQSTLLPPVSGYYSNGYIYGYASPFDRRLSIQLGVSVDHLRDGLAGLEPVNQTEVNPKLGLIWKVLPSTTLRAAAFRTLHRQIISNQTIEPSQVAGFAQFFDDIAGTVAWTYGAGLDQRITPTLHVGFEGTYRDLTVPGQDATTFKLNDFNWREQTARAYLYWAIPKSQNASFFGKWSYALSAEYQYEDFQRPAGQPGPEGFSPLNTTYVPLALTAFPMTYLSLRVGTTYIRQDGTLHELAVPDAFPAGGTYWVTDIGATYKLPGRRGKLMLGVNNLFNNKLLGYQDADPANPRYTRGQFAYARVVLQF
jgi:Tfp pilus assembly protein PilF